MPPGRAFGDLLQHGAVSNRLYSTGDVSVSSFLVHRVSLIHCVGPRWCPEPYCPRVSGQVDRVEKDQ